MAKQTFTTGQVLTAAQMTSLQQTAMGGGTASAKTASYVLVAADAGTAITMTSASPTTITVNTGLFSAGDTVQIINLGAGACTITAGTATVNTAGSLALSQYESGWLYFTATGTAVFNDYVQAASSTAGLELVLTQTIGSGVSSVVVSGAFSSTYDNYLVLISGGAASGNCNLTLQLGSTTSGYYWFGYYGVTSSTTVTGINGSNTANFSYAGIGSTNDINSITTIQAPNLAKRTHISTTSSRANSASNPTINRNEGFEDSNTQHTAFTIAPDAGTLTGGTIKVYGYKN